MIQNGYIGQVLGPFLANKDLLDDDGAIGIFTPENDRPIIYKLGIQATKGTIVNINDTPIKIGITGIYELDNDLIKVKKIVFPNGADEDTIIDFIYRGNAFK